MAALIAAESAEAASNQAPKRCRPNPAEASANQSPTTEIATNEATVTVASTTEASATPVATASVNEAPAVSASTNEPVTAPVAVATTAEAPAAVAATNESPAAATPVAEASANQSPTTEIATNEAAVAVASTTEASATPVATASVNETPCRCPRFDRRRVDKGNCCCSGCGGHDHRSPRFRSAHQVNLQSLPKLLQTNLPLFPLSPRRQLRLPQLSIMTRQWLRLLLPRTSLQVQWRPCLLLKRLKRPVMKPGRCCAGCQSPCESVSRCQRGHVRRFYQKRNACHSGPAAVSVTATPLVPTSTAEVSTKDADSAPAPVAVAPARPAPATLVAINESRVAPVISTREASYNTAPTVAVLPAKTAPAASARNVGFQLRCTHRPHR